MVSVIVRGTIQRSRQEGLLIEVGGASGLRGRVAVAPVQRDRMEEIYAPARAIGALGVCGLSNVELTEGGVARRLENIIIN